jgi:cytochrome c-type biogenesis protein CcmH
MKALRLLFFVLGLFLIAGCMPTAVNPTLAATRPVSSVSDDEVNAVAHQLYCPICQNISLDVCPTTACANWRELIREKLAAGWSKQQINDYFAMQYGSQVLPEPPLKGFNWLAYLLPVLVFLVVLVVGWIVIRRLQRSGRAVEAAARPTLQDDPYVVRLEEELRQRSRKD